MWVYFGIDHAIIEHDKVIQMSWWLQGTTWTWSLESALSTIQSDQYYPEFEAKLTKLVFSANKNHVFIEWNKRTSIALWAFFLEINGFDYRVGKFIVEMENIAVAVAEDLIDQEFLLEIITSILYEESYSENLQLRLIDALSRSTPSDY